MEQQDTKEIDRPHKVFGVLDGRENFHSGHWTAEAAKMRMDLANTEAQNLGIKTRYFIRG